MGQNKTISVSSHMGSGNKVTAQIGNHEVFIDQPQAAGGTDAGPTPLQFLAFSLAGCICSIARIVAHQKKIDLRGMQVDVQGDLDLDGLLGRSAEAKVGFPEFRIKARIDADLDEAQKLEFLKEVDRRCPVSDSLHTTTKIHLELD